MNQDDRYVIEMTDGPVRPAADPWPSIRDLIMPHGFRAGPEGHFASTQRDEIGLPIMQVPGMNGVSGITVRFDGDEVRATADLGRLRTFRGQSMFFLPIGFLGVLIMTFFSCDHGTGVLIAAGATGIFWLCLELALREWEERVRRDVEALFREVFASIRSDAEPSGARTS